MQSTLSEEERQLLLELAYQAVKSTAEGSEIPAVDLDHLPENVRQPGATFVTLSIDGALRGCIGTTQVKQALAVDVIERARAAASRDPRFPPVTPAEVPNLEIEVSRLTVPQALHFSSPQELLEKLKLSQQGVILKSGLQRATFLPQVWDRVNDPQTFLELLCQKAALHRDAWQSSEIQIETYQVESFHRHPKDPLEGSKNKTSG